MAAWRGRWSVALTVAVGFLATLSYAMTSVPTLPILASSKGASEVELGLIVAVALFVGAFARRVDVQPFGRIALTIGAIILAIAPLTYLLASHPWHFLGLRAVHGLALALLPAVAVATTVEAVRTWRVAGFSALGPLAGWICGPLLAGYLLESGHGSSALLAASGAGFLGLILLLVAGRVRWSVVPNRPPEAWLGASGPRAAVHLLIASLEAFLPLYGVLIGLSTMQIGLSFAACVAVAAVAVPAFDRMATQAPAAPGVLSLVACSLATGLIALSSGLHLLLLAMIVLGMGLAASGSAPRAQHAFDGAQARMLSIEGLALPVSLVAGPLLMGIAITALGYGTALLSTAICLAALASLTALWSPGHRFART
jgi:hypothetical protein